jgi:hypothetical protein
MIVKVKSYNSWQTFKGVKQARQDLINAIACCEGSERERYVYALIKLDRGCLVIDTDNQE